MEEYPYEYPMGRTSVNVVFSPRLALQRYAAVMEYLGKAADKDDIRIVTEYGPNHCNFLYQAQTCSWLEQINLVDLDRQIMSSSCYSLREYRWNRTQHGRIRKLIATAYQGNIASSDHRVSNSDAVIGIELIEHLTASDFDEFPRNVFGYIQPKYVIFTTPNREFNVLFDRPVGEFRHPDHKFEFTRAECRQWAQKIVDTYPSYDFQIYGIGAPPEGVPDVGFASQMIIFQRSCEPLHIYESPESYTLIGEVELNSGDDRTAEEKFMAKLATSTASLVCDLMFESAHSVYMQREKCKEDHTMDVVPLKMVVKYLEKEDIHTDVDTVLTAYRQHHPINFEIEMTIALGIVFVDQCECDSDPHEVYVEYNAYEPPSPSIYALPSHSLSINTVGSSKNIVKSAEICHYVEQFLNAVPEHGEFLLSTTRESCHLKHSISFITPEVVVAHLLTGGIETDPTTVLKVCQENGSKKYPLEETSFGPVIIIRKSCGDSPCLSSPEDSPEWENVDSPRISDSECIRCHDECHTDPAEE